jgi:DNA-binding NtrC family response regulator
MLNILLVGKDPVSLTDFAAELSRKEGVRVSRTTSVKEAWGLLGNNRVDVVVTDKELEDGSALPFIHELTKQQPLINCAMVSSLATKDFHEATEGLGVFMQLPVDPGAEDAVKMVHLLESIDALLSM